MGQFFDKNDSGFVPWQKKLNNQFSSGTRPPPSREEGGGEEGKKES